MITDVYKKNRIVIAKAEHHSVFVVEGERPKVSDSKLVRFEGGVKGGCSE